LPPMLVEQCISKSKPPGVVYVDFGQALFARFCVPVGSESQLRLSRDDENNGTYFALPVGGLLTVVAANFASCSDRLVLISPVTSQGALTLLNAEV